MMRLPALLDRGRIWGLAAVAALMLAQGAAAGTAAFATRALFDALHRGGSLPGVALAALAGAGAVIAATRVAARQLGERIGQDYVRDIRAALFDHAASLPSRAVAARRTGFTSLRFVGDMAAFRNWLALGLPRLIAASVLLPAMLAVLWRLAPALALAAAPILALTLTAICLGGLRLVALQRRLRVQRARIAAEMAERMPLAPLLDRLGRRGRERALLDRRSAAMARAALHRRRNLEVLKALPDLVAGLLAALFILIGHRADLGSGNIAAALAALGLLLAPLRDLGGIWDHRAAHVIATAKARAVLARPPRDLYRAGRSLPPGPVEVRFDDVALPSGRRLSFLAPAGGVSTLALGGTDAERVIELLLGLDAPASGRVTLSGIALPDLSRGTLRRNVGCLGAPPTILHGSLRRGLVLGCKQRPADARLEQLAREVGLGDALQRLGGLDGTLHEGGRNLATAEHLAITRARIRLARPRVLLIAPDVSQDGDPLRDLGNARRDLTVIRLSRLPPGPGSA